MAKDEQMTLFDKACVGYPDYTISTIHWSISNQWNVKLEPNAPLMHNELSFFYTYDQPNY